MTDGAGPHTAVELPGLREFRDAMNTVFQLQIDDGDTAEMTLVAVDESEARPGWESFSMLFVGPHEPFPQATYPVRHPDLGSFPLFVVPVLSDTGGQAYESVFNRPAG